jgi:tetratricopeptide (TPR) repeat protein/energy-coupling factor transporter ATP-binding protein EcfA2
MSSLDVEQNTVDAPYNSLSALREVHTRLLKLYKEGETEEVLAEIETFVRRGSATGTLLDNENDRYAGQSLLDYWMTVLYRARRNTTDATLAEFDPSLALKLDDSLCPYRGLNAFQEEDKDIFCGRQRLIEKLIEKTKETRMLFIVGPSGSGKSSLVLAGMIPALKNGATDGSKNWQYFPRIVPGSNPLKGLAFALGKVYQQPADWLTQETEKLKQDPRHLLNTIESAGSEPAVLIVDQLEEVFTLCTDDALRDGFINNLVALTESSGPRHLVILTLRTDFETYLVQNSALMSIFEKGQVRVMPLTATDLRSAIEEPAKRIGLKFEDGVVDALVNDILGEPAGLPLLQFALLRLWKMREDGRNRITLKDYRKLGGARRALALTADDFYQSLSDEKQITAKRIMLRLARPSGNAEVTSNPVRRKTLYFEAPYRVDEVLEELRDAGLVRITKGETKEQDKVEVAHEALVRNWGTLVDWIEKERASMRQRLRLTASAEQWLEHGKDQGGLLGGSLLEEALRYDDLNDLEKEFVRVSKSTVERAEQEKEEARQREKELEQANMLALQQKNEAIARNARRLRSFLTILALLFIVSIGTAVYAISQARRAAANEALAMSRQAETDVQKMAAQDAAMKASEQRELAEQRKEDVTKALEKYVVAERIAKVESEKAKKQAELADARRKEAEQATQRALKAEKAAREFSGQLKKLNEANAQQLALKRKQVELIQGRDEADAFRKRGQPDKAIELYQKILPEFQAVYENRKDTEHVLSGLSLAYRTMGEKSNRKGDVAAGQKYLMQSQMSYQDALNMFETDLATMRHRAGDLIPVLQEFAQFYKEQGKAEEAEKTYLEVLEMQGEKSKSQPFDSDAFNTQVDNLVEFYRSQHNEAALESLYKRVVDIKRGALGDFDPEVFDSVSDLARFYRDEEEHEKAEPLYLKALELVQESINRTPDLKYDPNIVRILAESENDLGDLYRKQENNPKAEDYYTRALQHEGALETIKLADLYANLGDVQRKQGKNTDALASYNQALQKYSGPLSNDRGIADSLNAMGEIYQKRGDLQKAEESFTKVTDSINANGSQAEKDELARALINLAGLKYMLATKNPPEAQKYVGEAEELSSRALAISPDAQDMSRRILEAPLNALSGMGFAKDNPYGGELPYEQVLTLKEAKIKEGDLTQAQSAEDVVRGLERIYRAQGNDEKLVALYKRALALRIKENKDTTDNPDVYGTYNNLAGAYLSMKDYKNAEETYQKALGIVERVFGKEDGLLVVNSLINLANVYRQQRKYAEAEPLYQRAKLNLEKAKHDETPEMVQVLEGYADVLQNTNRAKEAETLKEAAQKIRSKIEAGEKKN